MDRADPEACCFGSGQDNDLSDIFHDQIAMASSIVIRVWEWRTVLERILMAAIFASIITALPARTSHADPMPVVTIDPYPNALGPLRQGSFASWPEQDRATLADKVRGKCFFFSTGATRGDRSDARGNAEYLGALIATCIAETMPPDWPLQGSAREQKLILLDAAKWLNPNTPDPDAVFNLLVKKKHD